MVKSIGLLLLAISVFMLVYTTPGENLAKVVSSVFGIIMGTSLNFFPETEE